MPLSIAELDEMPGDQAAELLTACCGSSRWVTAMLAGRPFGSRDALRAAADRVWLSLGRADWLEAFSHHPRIGEQAAAVAPVARAQAWSTGEQASMDSASDAERTELATLNGEYERRFGYIYVVCAMGKQPVELLALARERVANPPEAELAIAAQEQQKIMRLRLEKLLS